MRLFYAPSVATFKGIFTIDYAIVLQTVTVNVSSNDHRLGCLSPSVAVGAGGRKQVVSAGPWLPGGSRPQSTDRPGTTGSGGHRAASGGHRAASGGHRRGK